MQQILSQGHDVVVVERDDRVRMVGLLPTGWGPGAETAGEAGLRRGRVALLEGSLSLGHGELRVIYMATDSRQGIDVVVLEVMVYATRLNRLGRSKPSSSRTQLLRTNTRVESTDRDRVYQTRDVIY